MNKIRRVFISLLAGMLTLTTLLQPIYAQNTSSLKVHYIDVGGGDSVYIEYTDSNNDTYNMLIDGGYYSDYHRYEDTSYYRTYDQYFSALPNYSKNDSDYRYASYIKSDYSQIESAIKNSTSITETSLDSYTVKPSEDNDATLHQKIKTIKTNVFSASNACKRYLDSLKDDNGKLHINYIINTHPHEDHVGGLIPVISDENISYDQIYDNTPDGTNTDSYYYYSGWAIYFNLIAKFNTLYNDGEGQYKYNTIPSQLSEIKLGADDDTNAPVFTVISDGVSSYIKSTNFTETGNNIKDSAGYNSTLKENSSLWNTVINNTSTVLKLKFKSSTFLFTADMQPRKEANILGKASVKSLIAATKNANGTYTPQIQVLDAMHHGNSNNDFSKDNYIYTGNSADHDFYAAVYPNITIVQCGKDHSSSGVPRPKVANDVSMSTIYTTKECSDIEIITDGTTITKDNYAVIKKGNSENCSKSVKFILNNGAPTHSNYYTAVLSPEPNCHIGYFCSDCGIRIKTEIVHKENTSGSVITEATHNSAGVMGYYCQYCGELVRTSTIAQIAHSVARTVTTTAATLTTTGVKTSYCSCGAVVSQTATSKVKSKTLYKGKKVTLKSGTSGKLTWTSSKKSVATVSSKGVVTAKKAGTATITLKKNGKKVATCKITVKNPVLKVSKTSVSVKKGKSKKVTASCTPSGTFTWKSSNKKIATVSNGKITGKKKGTCKVTVKCNGVSKTIKVTVK